jgi:transposase InsO family protein
VCYDVFSKHVKLKAVTSKACLNKLINRYFEDVIKPKVILSDNGSQFWSPSWEKKLSQYGVVTIFTGMSSSEQSEQKNYEGTLKILLYILSPKPQGGLTYCHKLNSGRTEPLPTLQDMLLQN